MDACSDEAWPIERLAEVSCVSPAHFARSFKKAFGTPPHRYLLARRIERAKALLRETNQPVTEVAFSTGWLSMGTFCRTFRDVTGDNPAANRVASRTSSAPPEIPLCILKAIDRPKLTRAVLEKRRSGAADDNSDPNNEQPARRQNE